MGPQESTITYPLPYDHPYFGQLFLAAALGLVGYPHTLITSSTSSFSHSHAIVDHNLVNSIQMLYLVPRVIMGLLAVVDTLLVYKIAERRYSRNVAVIASVLFAVMPSLLYNRWVLLDSILMPFLLSFYVSKIDAEGPLKQIKQLYNNTHTKAVFDRGLVKIKLLLITGLKGTYP